MSKHDWEKGRILIANYGSELSELIHEVSIIVDDMELRDNDRFLLGDPQLTFHIKAGEIHMVRRESWPVSFLTESCFLE